MGTKSAVRVAITLSLGLALLQGCGRGGLLLGPGAAATDAGDAGADTQGDRLGGGGLDATDAPSDRAAERPNDTAADRASDVASDVASDLASDVASDLASPPDGAGDRPSDGRPPDVQLDSGSDTEDCGSLDDPRHCGSCSNDCSKLPNVDPQQVYCFSRQCYVYPSSCLEGFADCLYRGSAGCPNDLHADPNNCGGCGYVCGTVPGSPGICQQGTCIGECPAGWGDCTPAFGCETRIDTADDCGACGRKACDLPNVTVACQASGPSCFDAICAPGFANCDLPSPGCEAAYASPAASCAPVYRGTASSLTYPYNVPFAATPDGAQFIGGQFQGVVDLDPTGGVDERTSSSSGFAYITKLGADGTYGWTQTFFGTAYSDVRAVAATPDGGVIATGIFNGIIDLDPGAGTDYHASANGAPFVVRLTASGAFVWGRSFDTTSDGGSGSGGLVSLAPDGSIVIQGLFSYVTIDFDPGPATAERTAASDTIFLVKLTDAGAFAWVVTYDPTLVPACRMSPNGLVIGSDGAAWITGNFYDICDFDPGPGIDLRQSGGNGNIFAVKLDATGGYLGAWIVGGAALASTNAVAIDAENAIHLAGFYQDTTDFDPGPGTAIRAARPDAGVFGFVLTLGSNGAFQSVRTLPNLAVTALALTGEGGAVVAGIFQAQSFAMSRINPDQSSGWTISTGDYYSTMAKAIAVTPSGIVVAGTSSYPSDFDPGPGEDLVVGSLFVSRYGF
jgi:hypothetical protein